MKLRAFFFSLVLCLSASTVLANDAGLRFIKTRGYVVCGTDLSSKTLAYKDEEGFWKGIDADICRNFSQAILGSDDAFRLKNIPANQAAYALNNNKIDFMLGNSTLSAKQEIASPVAAVDVLYYDKQIFASRQATNASSMEDFKGAKVCVLDNSIDMANLNEYNHRYALEFKLLPFPNIDAAKQAFLLNRCELISGSEIYLRGLDRSVVAKDNKIQILPEIIAHRPIYAYSAKTNPTLRIIAKWIINAPKLAEQQGITSKNVDAFIGVRDDSLRNLLGLDEKLWKEFGLQPKWVEQALKTRGNFSEMFERNLGKESELGIDREKNYLIEKGGLITAQPFI